MVDHGSSTPMMTFSSTNVWMLVETEPYMSYWPKFPFPLPKEGNQKDLALIESLTEKIIMLFSFSSLPLKVLSDSHDVKSQDSKCIQCFGTCLVLIMAGATVLTFRRTKLKQTEVDCEYLKRCCENLTEENRRLQKEVNELRALKLSPQFYMNMNPPTTLTMCPQCERVAVSSASSSSTAAASTASVAATTARQQNPPPVASNQRPVPLNPWAAIFSNQAPIRKE